MGIIAALGSVELPKFVIALRKASVEPGNSWVSPAQTVGEEYVLRSNRVTTPKLFAPPFNAQKRSGSWRAVAVTIRPLPRTTYT
jgi:hypothetical protein